MDRPIPEPAPTGAATSPGPDPWFANRQNRWRWGWLWAAIWLVYLASPVSRALREPAGPRRVLAVAVVVLFAVAFVGTFLSQRWLRHRRGAIPTRVAWVPVAIMIGLAALILVLLGHHGIGVLVYVVVIAVFLLPRRAAGAVVLACLAAAVVLPRVVPGWRVDDMLAFQIFVTALAVWGVSQIIRRNAQLAAAHQEIARLAVADERNRFARDVHDLLGHSLTVVSVKAELAARLVRLDPDRAEAELADVQLLAREALHDVRGAVTGYRDVTLAGELASARAALRAAGIGDDLPSAIDAVPPERRELFGWVVREGVTNVVRHSNATRCRIRVAADAVEITDDGRGPGVAEPGATAGPAAGNGLSGLRERVAAAHGRLAVGRSAEGGFALRVSLP